MIIGFFFSMAVFYAVGFAHGWEARKSKEGEQCESGSRGI